MKRVYLMQRMMLRFGRAGQGKAPPKNQTTPHTHKKKSSGHCINKYTVHLVCITFPAVANTRHLRGKCGRLLRNKHNLATTQG